MNALLPLLAAVVGYGVPGGVVAVPLAETAVEARFDGRHAVVHRDYALIGIPLGTAPGQHSVDITTRTGSLKVSFDVEPKEFPVQRLTIANDRLVNPKSEDLVRIGRETARMRAAYALASPTMGDLHPFLLPVDGELSSPFGRKRILNGQPRSPHQGLDIAANTGTPMIAPAAGLVVVTGDFFFNGNTVMIDHGSGLVTMYCHLHEVHVREGDSLARGEAFGSVGATGRATGPHLHWTVSMHGTKVDPLALIQVLGDIERSE
ncbi:MAG: peptidoglycan DD-metalloendopeptidase family protein [Gammaproteobacteria bacterium]|nr:peptidoglycan DD-metalloendopeptidase family protein [Gammaproteobacteria bacterium]